MTEEEQNEIRAIVGLQWQIEEQQKEVSARLAPFKDKYEFGAHFVIDGEIWRMSRWGERRRPATIEMFSAWCLEKVGKSA